MANLTIPAIALSVIVFALVSWNLLLPFSSAANADLMKYARYVIEDEYSGNPQIQQYIDGPVVRPVQAALIDEIIGNGKNFHTGPRVLEGKYSSPSQVTLTFYVQYGNHPTLSDLVDTLRAYQVEKAVFFVEELLANDRPFLVQSLEHNGYKVFIWKNMSEYDREYPPSVFQGIVLSDKDLLANSQRDNNAVAFLEMALHQNDASIIAFTPKIMSHKLVLEEVLKYNDKTLIFTDSNKTGSTPNVYSPGIILETNPGEADPILDYADANSGQEDSLYVTTGDWTMKKLQQRYPHAVTMLHQNGNDAYLLLNTLVIGHDAQLKLDGMSLYLLSSTDKDGSSPPAVLEVRGNAIVSNSLVTSWDPVRQESDINAYHPRPYIVAKNGGVIDVYNSTISHLGYSLGGVGDTRYARSAISYYNTTDFEIYNSKIAYNYYGFYSDHATNFRIIGNEIYGNTRYGLDPHTGSKDFIVNSNHVHDNGNQGIICSLGCENVTITNNLVEYNVEGIGLHWLTNSSIIKDNIVRYNEKYGIFIQKQSFNNTVESNTVIGNNIGIGLLEGSNDNIIRSNILADNIKDDIFMEPDSQSNRVENAVQEISDPGGLAARIGGFYDGSVTEQ